jgi:homeobox protein cut-like
LTSTIPKLDSAASEIVAHQRDALVQRKDLAQKTKDFRKLDDTSKLVEYKSLLKGLPAIPDERYPSDANFDSLPNFY